MADTKALNAADLRGLTGKELNDQVVALKEELFNLRNEEIGRASCRERV